MKIGGINPNAIDRSQLNSTGENKVFNKSYTKFEDKFDFSDIEPGAYKNTQTDEDRLKLVNILRLLLRKSLQLGLNIRYSKKKKMGDYVLEARLEVKKTANKVEPSMYIPVYLAEDIIATNYCCSNLAIENCLDNLIEEVLKQYDTKELVQLLVTVAHEFGHFMSYNQGNHDKALQLGLELMYKKDFNDEGKFTYLVFAEEVIAWKKAKEWLTLFEFTHWSIFDKVKFNSLKAYNSLLNLEKASIDVCLKLSLIEDFGKIATRQFFGNSESEKK